VKDAVRRRIARLDDLIAKLGPIGKEFAPKVGTGGKHLLSHIDQQRRLDRKWLKALLNDIEANGIRDVATRRSSPGARRSECVR
jgi:hypothetical protein